MVASLCLCANAVQAVEVDFMCTFDVCKHNNSATNAGT